mgnify:CR=1 FL=1
MPVKRSSNVNDIIKDKMCIHCGLCYSICPTSAIEWDEERIMPRVVENECINCNLCRKVCPSVDFEGSYLPIYRDLKSYLIGPVREVMLSCATDERLRRNSSSGGFITASLITLLDMGVINGAVVVTSNSANPFLPRAIISKNKEEIENAKGSKYTIAPTGLLIRELMKNDGKFAVVGTPCQILAFKKAERVLKELKKKIVLYIGLFCGHVIYPEGYKMIIKKETGKSHENVKEIKYRGSGWPGYLSIVFKDGTILKLPHDYWIKLYFSSLLFTPKRCLMCNDATSELADISVGDPWIPEIKRIEHLGMSLVIARTKRGARILDKIRESKNLWFKKAPIEYITISQKTNISYKKFNSHLLRRKIIGSSEMLSMIYVKSGLKKRVKSFLGIWLMSNGGKVVQKYYSVLPKLIIKLYSIMISLAVH